MVDPMLPNTHPGFSVGTKRGVVAAEGREFSGTSKRSVRGAGSQDPSPKDRPNLVRAASILRVGERAYGSG